MNLFVKTITATLLLCLAYFIQVEAAEKEVTVKLDHATIYYQGAELRYSGSTTFAKGENEITIKGLSPNIDQSSLRITTSKFAVVNAFEFRVDHLTGSSEKGILKVWKDSLELCTSKVMELDDKIKNNENVLKLLSVNTGGSNEGGINFTELMKYADVYKIKSAELMTEQRKYNKNRTELNEIVNRLNAQIASEEYKINKQQGVLTVKVNSAVANISDIKLAYYTPDANWSPYYDVEVKGINDPVKLIFKAQVAQYTGLDWGKAALTLTTTKPNFGKTAPLFSAWFLNYLNINPVLSAKSLSLKSKADMSLAFNSNDYMVAEETTIPTAMGVRRSKPISPVMPELKMDDFVTQSSNDMSQSFDIDLPYTLTGNGKAQFLDLSTKEVKANFTYYAVPKLAQEAFLLAEITEWEKLGLMSGKANITFDGTYMGDTYINAQSTEEKLALTLGVDSRISVKREKLQDFSSKKFLGNDVKQAFVYKITIKNNQNQAIKMTVKDQYPLSTSKEIEVEQLKETTPPTTIDKEMGVLIWDFELSPGETKIIQNAYSVKYPKDKQLNL